MNVSFLISFTREKSETHMMLLQKRLFNASRTGVSEGRKAVRSCEGGIGCIFGLFELSTSTFLGRNSVDALYDLVRLSSSFGILCGKAGSLPSNHLGLVLGFGVGIGMVGCIFVHEWALAVAHSGAGLGAWAVFGCV